MLDGVSKEYIENRMSQLPEIKQGELHKVKKNESLWKIAKEQLGEDAKKSDILNYVYAIAKLNGLDTTEKMNRLSIDQQLYLPKDFKMSEQKLPNVTTNPIKSEQVKPVVEEKIQQFNSAETSLMERVNLILTNKTVNLVPANLMHMNDTKMYHVQYLCREDDSMRQKAIMSFTIDNSGNISNILLEDNNNINIYGYDYRVNKDGSIVGFHGGKYYGKTNKEQLNLLNEKLKTLVDEYKK